MTVCVCSGSETAEVTWHGKASDALRGQPINAPVPGGKAAADETSWLYLRMGRGAVCCDRHTEIAAIVSQMNPSLSSKEDSEEVGDLQQVFGKG